MRVSRNNFLLVVVLASLAVAAVLPAAARAVAPTANDLKDVTSTDGAQGAVAVGAGGTIIRTTDGGVVWTWPAPDAPIDLRNTFWDVGFDTASGKGWAIGDRGTILASTDAGATWSGNVSGTTWQMRDLCVVSGTTAYAVGGNLPKNSDFDQGILLCTVDGGVSWNQLPIMDPAFTDPSLDAIQYGAVSVIGNRIWILGWHDGTRYFIESVNGGVGWTGYIDGWQLTDLDQVAPGTGTGFGIGGAWIYSTANSWVNAAGTNPAQSQNDIDMFSATVGWAVGNAGDIQSTVNGGTWLTQTSGTTYPLYGVGAVSATDAWAVGDRGTIRRTTDSGTTWTLSTGPLDDSKPKCYALAKRSCYRNRYVSLKYKVTDTQSALVKVKIKIKKLNGRTVKTLGPKQKTTNVTLLWRFRCRLAKGKYKYWVYATDLAGNTQARIGKNYLTVK